MEGRKKTKVISIHNVRNLDDVYVDELGNVIIKNGELAKRVKKFKIENTERIIGDEERYFNINCNCQPI
ncbi:hypothetical protein ABES25_24015 [Bacillus gobiensis]|uniref:hypothetical protein n=1 Tax=Bacillus gobiensis TaxID=1441095 RepID=UPI003D19DD03